MVLLDTLHRLAHRHQWRLVIAHFNHQLRKEESEGDERFVRTAAKRLRLEFVSQHWPITGRELVKKHGVEMAARLARHEFLAQAAAERKIRTIALAHHADDQAELFFLRLFRGAGGEGLAGMKSVAGLVSGRATAATRLIRPLLEFRKKELQEQAKTQGIRFREDSTNASRRYARNRIRHQLRPWLARHYEPAIAKMVLRTMELAGTDADFVRQEAERWLTNPQKVSFAQLHPAVQRQTLRIQVAQLLVTPTYDLVEQLRLHPQRIVTADTGTALARDDAGRVAKIERPAAQFDVSERDIDLTTGEGRCQFAGATIAWTIKEGCSGYNRPAQRRGREYFNAEKVGNTATLRHWREGDRFQPIGMEKAVKLQDLFVNLKISRPRRHQLLVGATASGEIWWVEGLRIGERFKLGRMTKRVLAWRWSRDAREP